MKVISPDIDSLIIEVRGQKVILDSDLAAVYGVPTKRLNEQIKRNINRFPSDFAFQLTPAEKSEVVANCDHLRSLKYSPVLPRTGLTGFLPRLLPCVSASLRLCVKRGRLRHAFLMQRR